MSPHEISELFVSSVLDNDLQEGQEATDRVMPACVGVFVCVYFLCVYMLPCNKNSAPCRAPAPTFCC